MTKSKEEMTSFLTGSFSSLMTVRSAFASIPEGMELSQDRLLSLIDALTKTVVTSMLEYGVDPRECAKSINVVLDIEVLEIDEDGVGSRPVKESDLSDIYSAFKDGAKE